MSYMDVYQGYNTKYFWLRYEYSSLFKCIFQVLELVRRYDAFSFW